MTVPAELAAPLASSTPAINRRWAHRKWGLIRLLSPVVLLGIWQLEAYWFAEGVLPLLKQKGVA